MFKHHLVVSVFGMGKVLVWTPGWGIGSNKLRNLYPDTFGKITVTLTRSSEENFNNQFKISSSFPLSGLHSACARGVTVETVCNILKGCKLHFWFLVNFDHQSLFCWAVTGPVRCLPSQFFLSCAKTMAEETEDHPSNDIRAGSEGTGESILIMITITDNLAA